MAFELVARAQAKWRSILVFVLLQAAMRFVTTFIMHEADNPWLKVYASLAHVATSVYCLYQEWRLLSTDRDGDEAWPRLWA